MSTSYFYITAWSLEFAWALYGGLGIYRNLQTKCQSTEKEMEVGGEQQIERNNKNRKQNYKYK